MSKDKTLLSVQVALKAEAVTEAEQVRKIFVDAGFEAGPLLANNFSITAAEDQFEKFFKVRVKPSGAGAVQFAKAKGEASGELYPEDLPPALRDKVETVVFSTPPDFGPFNP